jgi:hypothetical protein
MKDDPNPPEFKGLMLSDIPIYFDRSGPPSEHDKHMNELAIRISRILDGELHFDAACASALMVAFALKEGFNGISERAEAWRLIKAFIEERLRS